MTRNNVFVGDRRVLRRYIGDRLIFDDLANKTEILSGTEIFTDEADEEASVHVAVDGKSWQEGVPSPDSPSEIHSLNYFNVVSSVEGRNLFSMSKFVPVTGTEKTNTGFILPISGWGVNLYYIDIKKNTTFTISAKIDGRLTIAFFSGSKEIKRYTYLDGEVVITENLSSDINSIRFTNSTSNNGFKTYVENLKLEKGNTATDWTPAPEDITESDNHPLIDKINLLLDEPLRSVGDVKDRLFRDVDGLWKVERNVWETVVDGSMKWNLSGSTSNRFDTSSSILPYQSRGSSHIIYSSHYQYIAPYTLDSIWSDIRGLRIRDTRYSNAEELKNFLTSEYDRGNPLTVIYQLETPIITALPQVLQNKLNNLRSFEDSNYIYTILPDESDIMQENLKPTLHATFKSIGWETFRKKVTKEE